VTQTPAAIMGLAQRGQLRVGAPADLLLFNARGYSELLSRPQSDRIVLRGGQPIDTTLPDYRELDHLMTRAQPDYDASAGRMHLFPAAGTAARASESGR
jgi:cytosine deaminase